MEKKTERYLVNRLEQLEKEVAQLKNDNNELLDAINLSSKKVAALRYVRRYFALDETTSGVKAIKVRKATGEFLGFIAWQDDEDYEDLVKALELKGEQ